MNTKNAFKKIREFVSLLSVLAILNSCDAEKDVIANSPTVKKFNSELTFTEFKKETGLSDFKTVIKIPIPNQMIMARNQDGSYELSDFDIDTDIIKKLDLDDKTTYTFRIFPKVIISPSSFYNLTMDYKDGQWIQNVIELKPTIENFDNIMSGFTNDINGKMSILYTSNNDGLDTPNNCYAVGIIGNNCGTPEISEECVTKKSATFCFDNENNILLGTESNIFYDINSNNLDYSFILNTNNLKKHLSIFAKNHVTINNKIITLLKNETDVNLDNFPVEDLTASQNEDQFRQALANSGIVNYRDLADLIIEQNQNARGFISNNKDFNLLKDVTKQKLIFDAINDALVENPIEEPFINPGNAVERTCAGQYYVDRDRCNQQNNINGVAVLVACLTTGPFGCGAATMIAMWQGKVCQDNAKADYYDCIR